MNSLRQLVVLSIAVLYFFLSTGVILFRTHCECSGSTSISLFAGSESNCDVTSEDSCCSDKKSCETGEPGLEYNFCECDSPLVTYLKLTDHFGEDSDLEYPFAKQLFLIHFSASEPILDNRLSEEPKVYSLYSPPQHALYGRFLLNYINQRKIDLLT